MAPTPTSLTTGILEKVTDYVSSQSPSSWSSPVIGRAHVAFIDTISCMLAGSQSQVVLRAAAATRASARGTSTVVGQPDCQSMEMAAFLNGTAARALDYDDLAPVALAHASAPLVAALLAVGEGSRATGISALDAYIVGFELLARLGVGMMARDYYRGWHSTASLTPPAVALACSRMMRLTPGESEIAVSLAASMAGGLKRQLGTMAGSLHAGFAAKNGLVATLLASAGISAARDVFHEPGGFFTALIGEGPKPWNSSLEPAIATCGNYLKRYPCCTSIHPAIDAALALRREGASRAKVARIGVTMPREAQGNLRIVIPNDPQEAAFSPAYCVSTALLDGDIKLRSFSDEAIRRPDVVSFMKRTEIAFSSPHGAGLPSEDWASLRIELENGRVLQRRSVLDHDPQRVVPVEALKEKFEEGAARSHMKASRRRLTWETLERLPLLDDLRQLAHLLRAHAE